MKTFSLIILSNIFVYCVSAQIPYDTIFPIVNGHQVSIYQNNAYHNCGFSPGLRHVTINDTLINWYQVDTIAIFYGCMCFFDYSVSIDTLKAGTYLAKVYSVYNTPDIHDTAYQGSTSFTIIEQNECDNQLNLSSTKSNCHPYNALKKNVSFDEIFSVQAGKGWFTINCKGAFRISDVSFFNLLGQKVLSKSFDNASESILYTTTLKPGVYMLSVTDHQKKTLSKKIIVQ